MYGRDSELLVGIAEDAPPGGIHALEIAVDAGDAHHVERQQEEPIELFLRAAAIDEHADLIADGRRASTAGRVGLADIPAEELHDAEHFAAEQHREAERRVQSLGVATAAREVRSRVTSGIHAGSPLVQTRPGRPTRARTSCPAHRVESGRCARASSRFRRSAGRRRRRPRPRAPRVPSRGLADGFENFGAASSIVAPSPARARRGARRGAGVRRRSRAIGAVRPGHGSKEPRLSRVSELEYDADWKRPSGAGAEGWCERLVGRHGRRPGVANRDLETHRESPVAPEHAAAEGNRRHGGRVVDGVAPADCDRRQPALNLADAAESSSDGRIRSGADSSAAGCRPRCPRTCSRPATRSADCRQSSPPGRCSRQRAGSPGAPDVERPAGRNATPASRSGGLLRMCVGPRRFGNRDGGAVDGAGRGADRRAADRRLDRKLHDNAGCSCRASAGVSHPDSPIARTARSDVVRAVVM